MNSDLHCFTPTTIMIKFKKKNGDSVEAKRGGINFLHSSGMGKHISLLLIMLFSISFTLTAQTNTWDGSSSANWNTATNWSLNQVPTAAHDVVIPNGITANITVNTAAVCKTLTMNGGTTANTLTINNPNSLSVAGAIAIGAGTGAGDNKIIAVGTGTLSCASVNITATGSGTRTSEISIATGTVNVTGNISMNDANDYIRFTGAGLLNVGGNITGGNLIPSTGTVNCNGSTAQTITGATTSSFYNLIINKSAAANTVTSTGNAMTVANNLTITQGNLLLQATNANYTISNDLVIPVGGTLTHSVNWDVAGRSLNIGGNVIIDGLFTYTVRSHVQMSGTNKTIRTGPLPSGFSILTLVNTAGTISANGLVTVNDNFWAAFNVNGGTFSTNGQTVNANASLLNSGGTILVNGGNLNITGGLQVGTGSLNGTMTISSGTVTTDGFTIGNGTRTGVVNQTGGTTNINGNLLINSACTYNCTNAPAINISGNWTINNTGVFAPAISTVTFNNAAASQDINGTATTKEFYNVAINKPGQTLMASGSTNSLHLDGSLQLNTGTFNAGTATSISIEGDWINNDSFIAGPGNVTFNGSAIQQISGSTATHFNNLTINNNNNVQLNAVDAYVDGSTGALHFDQGKLVTGSQTLVLGNATSITGAANGKYVFGNLQMGVALGDQVKFFAIGDGLYFAPVTLTINQAINAGSITAFTLGAEHPSIATSSIDESQDANRYWTLVNNAVIFTNYDATFQYHLSDVDAGANTANFILGQYNGSWNYPAVGIIGVSDITSIGLTDFGEFCVGEGGASAPTIATDPADQTFCSNSVASFTATANSRPVSIVQWEISTDGGGIFTPLSMVAPYSMTTSSAAGITSSTLSINQPLTGFNGHQFRAVFTNNRGNITSAAAILTVSTAATADAGIPQTICVGSDVTLAGNIGGTATMSTWSAASGSFSDPASLTSTYTPVIGPGNIMLTLTTDDPDGVGPCIEAVSTVLISIDPPATITAGPDNVICSNATATMAGSFGGGAGSATWSTSGTGSFNNNTPTAVYTPSVADIAAGSVILTYTTNDPAGPCNAVNASMTLTINQAPTVNAGGPQTICSGSTIALSGSIGGGATSSTWSAPSGLFSDAGSPVSDYSPSISSGSVTLTLTSDDPDGPSGPCSSSVSTALFTVNTSPTALTVTPASANVCQENIINLSASGGNTIITSNASFSSGVVNVAIPDNNAGGATSILAASGIPAGATINSISVNFNILHNNVGDLVLNIKAPNGNVLNLVNRKGNTGNNFTNSTAASNGVTLFSAGTAPFNGTFAADAVNGVGATGQVSNVILFSGLYSVPNGNWTFSARDASGGTSGTISSWSIVINWTAPVQDPVTWTPVTDLYTNAAATVPYLAGQNFASVFVKPSSNGNIIYTASATSANGCTASGTADLTVIPAPLISALPATQSICSQSSITQIDITNPNNLPGTTFSWTRNNTINLTGIASSGTGNAISGTLTNSTNNAQTTIFTITADDGTCTTTQTVSVTVNPKPTVNATPATQTVCSAIAIGTITITNPNAVAGTTFSWTRDNTVNLTGIAGSGSGASITGTLTNTSNIQQVTTFTITATAGTCSSVTSVTVTVNPKPTVSATPLTQTLCSAVAFGQIDIANPNSVAGTLFTWTRDNTVNLTGVAASGSGAAINGTFANATNVQQTTNFTITATAGACTSTTTVNVKVNPVPGVNSIPNASFCNNGNGSAINFGSNVPGATFAWTSTANVGFGTSGNGNIPAYVAANAPVTATVSVTATANGCSGPVRTFTITINPLPTVTVSADYCIVPGKVRLTANPLPAGSYTYLWSTGATTQVIDVDIAGSYTVTVTNTNGCKATNSISIATELAVNGNFEAGNVGFTSGYTYDPSANGLFAPEGKYAVNNSPNFNHNNFWGTDHTTASGRMMIVNGIVGPTVWQQTVAVLPNTTYYFSAWALSMNNAAPFAQLQFSVNGSPIGVSAVLIAGVNNNASNTNWQRFYGTWNSGALTSATCSILDLQGALGGNDFALDDISISTLSPAVFSAIPSVLGGGTVVCEGSNLQLSANLQGGSSPYTFTWTGPGGFTSNVQNPVIPNATVANSGTYSLSVIDFYGCVINSSRNITISAPPSAPSPVTATPATICLGNSTNLNGTTINGTQSDFTGAYAPANWVISNNPALTGGSVNTSGAPNLISITSGNNGTAGNTDFTITNGPLAGNYIFNWSYTTTDAASRDIPQYSVNGGAAVNLPGFNTAGGNTQNGTASIAVPANQTFALRMRTTNGTGGNGTVTFTIFNAPQAASIRWYTVATAGTNIGTSVNAAIFRLSLFQLEAMLITLKPSVRQVV